MASRRVAAQVGVRFGSEADVAARLSDETGRVRYRPEGDFELATAGPGTNDGQPSATTSARTSGSAHEAPLLDRLDSATARP